MRIAFLVGQFPALSETFILDQVTALIDRGHSVSIFAERRSSDAEVHPDVERYGLQNQTRYELLPERFLQRLLRLPTVWRPSLAYLRALNCFRYGGNAASLRLAWAASLFEGARDFDIVQCHFGALGLKAVLLREIGALRGKIVTAFHGEDITNYPRRFRGRVYAPLFAHGDLFLPISERWNDALTAMGCPPERIRVHRMGIPLRHFSRRTPTQSLSGPLRILTVGRLVEKKGIADAIEAVSRIAADYEHVIAGDGPLRSELEALAQARGIAGKVRFTGAQTRKEVAALLQSADVFLAPSVTGADGDIEGIPVTIMEAMASGLPVVATRHSAIPELVVDGVSGFLVAEHDIEGLAGHLSTLAADAALRSRMGDAGHAIVSADFEINALTARLEGFYNELLHRS